MHITFWGIVLVLAIVAGFIGFCIYWFKSGNWRS